MGLRKTGNTLASNEKWRFHDSYQTGPSCNRIVTRSQSAFLRLRNTPSDLNLFADFSRHHPPKRPPLMETLKGKYGSIPRTITTRSFGKHISIDFKLREKIDFYKKYEIQTEMKTTLREKQVQKENQAKEEEKKKKQAEEERRRKEAEEKAKKEKQAEMEEKKRIQAEEEERKKKQADEEERMRIQLEEEERMKIQADEEERRIQAEEEEIKKKRDEENKGKKDDDDNNGRGRSGSFFGGRITLKSLSNIFSFGSNAKYE